MLSGRGFNRRDAEGAEANNTICASLIITILFFGRVIPSGVEGCIVKTHASTLLSCGHSYNTNIVNSQRTQCLRGESCFIF